MVWVMPAFRVAKRFRAWTTPGQVWQESDTKVSK